MEFNKIKSKTTKLVAMFLALSFAATLFSTPGMTGTATAQQNACPPGYVFNPQQGQCIDGSACPTGTTFNPSTNTCVDGPPSCPQGTTYNPTTNKCEAEPTCPTGFTLDTTLDKCVTQASAANCPASNNPIVINSQGQCQTKPGQGGPPS